MPRTPSDSLNTRGYYLSTVQWSPDRTHYPILPRQQTAYDLDNAGGFDFDQLEPRGRRHSNSRHTFPSPAIATSHTVFSSQTRRNHGLSFSEVLDPRPHVLLHNQMKRLEELLERGALLKGIHLENLLERVEDAVKTGTGELAAQSANENHSRSSEVNTHSLAPASSMDNSDIPRGINKRKRVPSPDSPNRRVRLDNPGGSSSGEVAHIPRSSAYYSKRNSGTPEETRKRKRISSSEEGPNQRRRTSEGQAAQHAPSSGSSSSRSSDAFESAPQAVTVDEEPSIFVTPLTQSSRTFEARLELPVSLFSQVPSVIIDEEASISVITTQGSQTFEVRVEVPLSLFSQIPPTIVEESEEIQEREHSLKFPMLTSGLNYEEIAAHQLAERPITTPDACPSRFVSPECPLMYHNVHIGSYRDIDISSYIPRNPYREHQVPNTGTVSPNHRAVPLQRSTGLPLNAHIILGPSPTHITLESSAEISSSWIRELRKSVTRHNGQWVPETGGFSRESD
ncbi:hypothetical protein M422DRAFT_66786 [Sphaerobolus stellatus SS14]|nr:hypothetical protein M422DRAFT_66786 [Sphaerobolus stellatus SS14]